jgi:hypothetical protein
VSDTAKSVVLDRELEEEKTTIPPAPVFAARSVVGRPAKKTNGSASAVIRGTRSTQRGGAATKGSVAAS